MDNNNNFDKAGGFLTKEITITLTMATIYIVNFLHVLRSVLKTIGVCFEQQASTSMKRSVFRGGFEPRRYDRPSRVSKFGRPTSYPLRYVGQTWAIWTIRTRNLICNIEGSKLVYTDLFAFAGGSLYVQ